MLPLVGVAGRVCLEVGQWSESRERPDQLRRTVGRKSAVLSALTVVGPTEARRGGRGLLGVGEPPERDRRRHAPLGVGLFADQLPEAPQRIPPVVGAAALAPLGGV